MSIPCFGLWFYFLIRYAFFDEPLPVLEWHEPRIPSNQKGLQHFLKERIRKPNRINNHSKNEECSNSPGVKRTINDNRDSHSIGEEKNTNHDLKHEIDRLETIQAEMELRLLQKNKEIERKKESRSPPRSRLKVPPPNVSSLSQPLESMSENDIIVNTCEQNDEMKDDIQQEHEMKRTLATNGDQDYPLPLSSSQSRNRKRNKRTKVSTTSAPPSSSSSPPSVPSIEYVSLSSMDEGCRNSLDKSKSTFAKVRSIFRWTKTSSKSSTTASSPVSEVTANNDVIEVTQKPSCQQSESCDDNTSQRFGQLPSNENSTPSPCPPSSIIDQELERRYSNEQKMLLQMKGVLKLRNNEDEEVN